MITLEEFRDKYEYAPLDLEELAELMDKELGTFDAPVLVDRARQYLIAKKRFEGILNHIDFEVG